MLSPLRSSVTELITGGAVGTVTVTGVRFAGVISTPLELSVIVSVMVPAVDPVAKSIAGIAVLLFVLGLNLLGEGLRRRAGRPA